MRSSTWIGRALFAIAAVLLGYCGFVVLDGWRFQNVEDSQLEQLQHERQALSGDADRLASASLPNLSPSASDGLIGRLGISRLGLSTIVMEGTGKATLRHAVGHITGMALPGQPGNVGIAGHRDTYFRPLRNVRQDDIITFTTPAGEYRYRVVSTMVVGPRDVTVLDGSEDQILTLVTCYPFYFAGPAPDRFIVRAERINSGAL